MFVTAPFERERRSATTFVETVPSSADSHMAFR
jgi:hypothetical protein